MQRFGMPRAGRGSGVIALMQRPSLVVSTPLIVVASLFSTDCCENAAASPPALATASPPPLAAAAPPASAQLASPPASALASQPASALASQPASALQAAPVTPPAAPPTRSLPASPALSREAVESALNVLLESGRIDAAMRARALDVLFPAATLSLIDSQLAALFRELLLADGAAREERAARLDTAIARIVDRAPEVWRVSIPDLQGEIDPRTPPELASALANLLNQGYPLFVRDVVTGIDFRLIPGGEIPGRPAEARTIVEPFYIAICEVDECDWFRFRGGDRASLLPVEEQSWESVARYCAMAGLSLPTEAEWEFAARAGANSPFWMGEMPVPGEVHCAAVKADEANRRGQDEIHQANCFGLYHVHGNVAEWCTHPLGGTTIATQVVRGGDYTKPVEECTVSSRVVHDKTKALPAVGFRPIRRLTPGTTRVTPCDEKPLRVVVVDDGGALNDHWRVRILNEFPSPEIYGLDPEYCLRVMQSGLPWEVLDLETDVRMRLVPAGEFITGKEAGSDAGYRVLIAHPFYLSESEITEIEWNKRQRVLEGNPLPTDRPIASQSWHDCLQYMRAAKTGLRFPNEFEWEWACTLGRNAPFAWDARETLARIDRCNHAGWWKYEPLAERLRTVGQTMASPTGFRGMHGNVSEWCLNQFDLDRLLPDLADRPTALDGATKSVRGGSATDIPDACWAGVRAKRDEFAKSAGLRLARSVVASRDLFVEEWPEDARRRPDDVERPRPGDVRPDGELVQEGGGGKPGEAVGGGRGNRDGGGGAVPTRPPTGRESGGGNGAGNGVGKVRGRNNGSGARESGQDEQGGGNEDDKDVPAVPDGPIETSLQTSFGTRFEARFANG